MSLQSVANTMVCNAIYITSQFWTAFVTYEKRGSCAGNVQFPHQISMRQFLDWGKAHILSLEILTRSVCSFHKGCGSLRWLLGPRERQSNERLQLKSSLSTQREHPTISFHDHFLCVVFVPATLYALRPFLRAQLEYDCLWLGLRFCTTFGGCRQLSATRRGLQNISTHMLTANIFDFHIAQSYFGC